VIDGHPLFTLNLSKGQGDMRRAGLFSVTNILIAINVAVYAFIAAHGGPNQNDPYYVAGVLYGPAVLQDGQWYRVITGAFLHGGLAHVSLNMIALYQLGLFVETLLGSWRMLAIYSISLLGGGLAVVYFDPQNPTVGASGAIFGLFGALLAIGLRLGERGRSLIAQTVPILILNLVFTFAVPFISKAGHLGGLISGFLAGLVLFAMRPQQMQTVAVGVTDRATGAETQAELLPPESREPADSRESAESRESHESPGISGSPEFPESPETPGAAGARF
jgi:membrane associated rhomboid family serine protease